MRIREMLQNHIRRMEDAMLEDVIKPLRELLDVSKQKNKDTTRTPGSFDKQSRPANTNITKLVRTKRKKTTAIK